jgi:lipopolysaccharide export LptBFGC system permease protein LptF
MKSDHSILLGAITGTAIGAFVFQIFSIFVLALVGALAGFIFSEYIKPWLKPKFDKLFNKKD